MLVTRFSDTVRPSGRESFLGDEEIIVTKTDILGHITYANDVFLRVANLTEQQALGAPHCIIRHPAMPRCVFKLLWDTLAEKKEVFAYVNNMASNGDNYWVFAHVTPTLDRRGNIVAYHSSRRKPTAAQVAKVAPIYASLLDVERRHSNPKEAAAAGLASVGNFLRTQGMPYDEFIFTV